MLAASRAGSANSLIPPVIALHTCVRVLKRASSDAGGRIIIGSQQWRS